MGWGGHASDLCGGINAKLSTHDYIQSTLGHAAFRFRLDALPRTHTEHTHTHAHARAGTKRRTMEKIRRGSSWCGLGGSCWTTLKPFPPPPFRHLMVTNAEHAREAARDEGVRDARRHCTEPRHHGFTIPTAQGRGGGGRRRA